MRRPKVSNAAFRLVWLARIWFSWSTTWRERATVQVEGSALGALMALTPVRVRSLLLRPQRDRLRRVRASLKSCSNLTLNMSPSMRSESPLAP
ncbi:hypothetical protein D3C84_714710 [compost metagenome]